MLEMLLGPDCHANIGNMQKSRIAVPIADLTLTRALTLTLTLTRAQPEPEPEP